MIKAAKKWIIMKLSFEIRGGCTAFLSQEITAGISFCNNLRKSR